MNKVSIVLTVYNTEEFLAECVTSIVNQSYENLEIIIINDASTDGSLEILNSFTKVDKRIRVINNKRKMGVGACRNLGIDEASGEFIYFVDSDDLLHEDAIKILIVNIADNPLISGSISTVKNHDDITNFVLTEETTKYRPSDKLFKARSTLKVLYVKNYIIENNFKFSEVVDLYADHEFMYKIISLHPKVLYVRNSRYFKRKRNDPISNPSLAQMNRYSKIKNFVAMFSKLRPIYNENSRLRAIINKDFLNFYRKTVVMYMNDPEEFDEVFDLLHQCTLWLNKASVKKLNKFVKKELKYIMKNEKSKYRKMMNIHHDLRSIKKSLNTRRNFFTFIYRKWFLKKDIDENLIIYEAFRGKNYSCNPKYIYEYLLENKPEYKHVWIYNEKPLNIKGDPIQVKRFSIKYYYYMAKAKYWVFNTRVPKHVDKRNENIFLQTWHGTPLKTLAFDIKEIYSANPNVKKDFFVQTRRWDYLISPNAYSTEIFRRAFKYDNEMLEYGYPRNDILYRGNEKLVNEIKNKVGIPSDKKIILYAPTWRDDQFYEAGKYKFNLELDLQKLQQAFSSEYVIILRLHYHVASVLDVSEYERFAYDLSSYDDIAELYLISDILITDYSSVFFDYANLKRPMLFFTYDLETYRDKIRGLYFDIETGVPGPLLKTTDEIIYAIKNIKNVEMEFAEKYDEFYQKFCGWESGNASKHIVERVFR